MSSLKEELENVEIEEAEMDEEDRLRKIEESMYWVHRKIKVIAEYIDKEEKATPEEEELWDCGYSEGYEDGVNSVLSDNKKEMEAIEKVLGIPVPSENLTSLLHAIQNFMGNESIKEELAKVGTSSEYAKGYADGVKNLAERVRGDTDQTKANIAAIAHEAIQKALGKEVAEERKESETEKNRVLGLGREIEDV